MNKARKRREMSLPATQLTESTESQPELEMELVRNAAAGDTVAFESLYRMHSPRLYGLCLRMTGSPELAEECVQDAFVSAWRNLGEFRGQSAVGTWIHRIAVNEVLTRQRKDRRREDFLSVVDEDMAAQWQGDVERPLLAEDLEKAIGLLPRGARNVLVLHGIYGYSHEEAASVLGLAVGTCKAQLHRARHLLNERMKL